MNAVHQVTPYAPLVLESWNDDLVTRTGKMRPLRGHFVGSAVAAPDDMDELGRSRIPREIEVRPGVCVTWRCGRTVFGWDRRRECGEHAAEPMPDWGDEYRATRAAQKRAAYAANPGSKEKQRTRSQTWRSSLSPERREAINAARRARRAERKADPAYVEAERLRSAASYAAKKQREGEAS